MYTAPIRSRAKAKGITFYFTLQKAFTASGEDHARWPNKYMLLQKHGSAPFSGQNPRSLPPPHAALVALDSGSAGGGHHAHVVRRPAPVAPGGDRGVPLGGVDGQGPELWMGL